MKQSELKEIFETYLLKNNCLAICKKYDLDLEDVMRFIKVAGVTESIRQAYNLASLEYDLSENDFYNILEKLGTVLESEFLILKEYQNRRRGLLT